MYEGKFHAYKVRHRDIKLNSSVLWWFVTSQSYFFQTILLDSSFTFMDRYPRKYLLWQLEFELETLLPLQMQFRWNAITVSQVCFRHWLFSFMPFPFLAISLFSVRKLQRTSEKKNWYMPFKQKQIKSVLFLIGLCWTTQTLGLKKLTGWFWFPEEQKHSYKHPVMQLCWHYKISTPSETLQISQRQEKERL